MVPTAGIVAVGTGLGSLVGSVAGDFGDGGAGGGLVDCAGLVGQLGPLKSPLAYDSNVQRDAIMGPGRLGSSEAGSERYAEGMGWRQPPRQSHQGNQALCAAA